MPDGPMAGTGVVGVVTPLDLPDNQSGESPIADDAKDGRRSLISKDEKLSESEGQSRSEDKGENRLHSVSNGGRCSSKAAPMMAISRVFFGSTLMMEVNRVWRGGGCGLLIRRRNGRQ